MVKFIKINKILVDKSKNDNDSIYADTSVIDTADSGAVVYTRREMIKMLDLPNLISEHGLTSVGFFYKDGNFTVEGDAPKIEEVDDIEYYDKYMESPSKKSLTGFLRELGDRHSKIVFLPEYYSSSTSTEDFRRFTPTFEEAVVNLKNLIISGKKFNIVLTSVIPGIKDTMGIPSSENRYYPFKLVKYGELMYNEIYVYATNLNVDLLSIYGTPHDELTYRVDLTQFSMFDDYSQWLSVSSLGKLADEILTLKSIVKGLGFYRQKLKSALISQDAEYDLITDWARGDALEEPYVSDVGTESIEVWVKGKKSIKSTATILKELTEAGDLFEGFTNTITGATFVKTSEVEVMVNSLMSTLQDWRRTGTVNQYEFMLLASVLQSALSTGTRRERYDYITGLIQKYSSELTGLETFLLQLRWTLKALTESAPLGTLPLLLRGGLLNKSGNASGDAISVDPHNPNIPEITIKKSIISDAPINREPNYNPADLNKFITSDIKGVDFL